MTDEETRPRFLRRRLGGRLRQLRENAGLNSKQAAERLHLSTATLSKIELGRQGVKPAYVLLMGTVYGIPEPVLSELLTTAKESNQSGGWLRPYSSVLRGDFRDYHEMERSADIIFAHETACIFGLFQTENYIWALGKAALPTESKQNLEISVQLRLERQRRLYGDNCPKLHVILSEAVLHRLVGGRKVMQEQLDHLLSFIDFPSITIQVMPFTTGAYAAMSASFIGLDYLNDPDLGLVYIENDCVATYLDRPNEIRRYKEIFQDASRTALSESESIKLIDKIRGDV